MVKLGSLSIGIRVHLLVVSEIWGQKPNGPGFIVPDFDLAASIKPGWTSSMRTELADKGPQALGKKWGQSD
jgi:hypothetical protein